MISKKVQVFQEKSKEREREERDKKGQERQRSLEKGKGKWQDILCLISSHWLYLNKLYNSLGYSALLSTLHLNYWLRLHHLINYINYY